MGPQMSLAELKKTIFSANNLDHAEKIFIEHGHFIRTAIRFHVKNEAECDDLFQEFFMSLMVNPIPEDVKNIRGFLYRAVTSRAKDAFKRVTRYRVKLCEYAEKWQHPIEDSPETMAIEKEEIEKVFQLIHKHLPKKEAMAVSLRYGKNGDNREVAETMGVKAATINRYVCIGIKKIREILAIEKGGEL